MCATQTIQLKWSWSPTQHENKRTVSDDDRRGVIFKRRWHRTFNGIIQQCVVWKKKKSVYEYVGWATNDYFLFYHAHSVVLRVFVWQ